MNNIQNNNFNFNIAIDKIVPFDQPWSTAHISDESKSALFHSKHKFSKLLSYILNDSNNLNVLLNKDESSGLVYKNKEEQYVKMNKKDILDGTYRKLINHFIEDVNNLDKNETEESYIKWAQDSLQISNSRHKNNETVKEHFFKNITEIYESKIEESLVILNMINEANKNANENINENENVNENENINVNE